MVKEAEEPQDLFENGLDGNQPAEVFYFPDSQLLPADKVSALEYTSARLRFISGVILEAKFTGAASFSVVKALEWISHFNEVLEEEKIALKKLLPTNRAQIEIPTTTTNGSNNG